MLAILLSLHVVANDQARDAIRAKHRSDDHSSDSDYDSLDDEGDRHTGSPRSGPRGYVDYTKVEAADMDTHIPANNVGYKLLLKMGWKAGTGLGQNASGTKKINLSRERVLCANQ